MKKVLCCIPTLGTIRIELCQRLYEWKARYGNFFDVYPVIGKTIPEARNECANTFLKSDASYLFFCDSDIIPPTNAIDMLLSHGFDKKIISGLCPIIKRDSDGQSKKIYLTLKKVALGEYKIIDTELNGLIEVDATGTACVMIHRSVFKKITPPWFANLAEDFFFYEKAREAGFKVYVDHNCKVTHWVVMSID